MAHLNSREAAPTDSYTLAQVAERGADLEASLDKIRDELEELRKGLDEKASLPRNRVKSTAVRILQSFAPAGALFWCSQFKPGVRDSLRRCS